MENKAKEINQMIKNSSVYIRYLECKKNIENDDYLNDLQFKMKTLKDQNCLEKDEKLINEYYKLENDYYSNVVVKEYQKSKDELSSLLNDIADILYVK